jgi:two-component system, NtrC family, response regulator HydG
VDPERNLVSVVIIDDNPRSLEFISTALTRPGVQIFTAVKPEDGLTLISLYHPQIVITDMIMPGMTGLDVLRYVKEFDPATEVIVMSARESGGSPERALQEGAADYLRKPIALSVLRERVGRLIQNHVAERVKP